VQNNRIAPPVYVEGVRADRRDYAFSGLVRLPAHSRDIEIGYTALSYSIPQKVLFRYRLDGRDHDWQDAGTRRQAFYNDLPPGQYHFHVTASNNDGVWNDAGALLDFSIDPAYYQTRGFQVACIAALLAAIWGLYRYRLRQIAHEFNVRLEERVGERTRIARDLHDTLLQNFHGVLPRLQAVYKLLPERVSEAKEILNTTIDDAAQAITEARDAVQNLRSSTAVTNDLAKAVQTLGEDLAAHQNATNGNTAAFTVEVEGAPQDLHPILRDEIYRIAAEAVRNAFNHARARRIEVEIWYSAQDVRVRVRDDGAGIEPNVVGQEGREGHFGLAGMRERAEHICGKLDIWSERGAGTEVELRLPASVAYTHQPGRRSIFTRNASTKR
jgi:signal transduction histidine kinase